MSTYLIISFLYVILLLPIIITSTYYIFGFLPSIKACNLNEEQKNDLLEYGIIHCTKKKNADLIKVERIIKSSNRIKSYSNHFHRCVYFYSVKYIDETKIKFNTGTNKNHKIIIANLTEQQINNFKIRKFDNSLMYDGDLRILNENDFRTEEISELYRNRKLKIGFLGSMKQYSKYTIQLHFIAALLFCVYSLIYLYIIRRVMY